MALLECPPPWNSMVPKASVGLSCVCLQIDHFSDRLSFLAKRSALSFWLVDMPGGKPTCWPIRRPQQHLREEGESARQAAFTLLVNVAKSCVSSEKTEPKTWTLSKEQTQTQTSHVIVAFSVSYPNSDVCQINGRATAWFTLNVAWMDSNNSDVYFWPKGQCLLCVALIGSMWGVLRQRSVHTEQIWYGSLWTLLWRFEAERSDQYKIEHWALRSITWT